MSTALPPVTPLAALTPVAPGRTAPPATPPAGRRHPFSLPGAGLHTVRARLSAGFGATLVLLAAAGALGVVALRAQGAQGAAALAALHEHYDTVQQVGNGVLREGRGHRADGGERRGGVGHRRAARRRGGRRARADRRVPDVSRGRRPAPPPDQPPPIIAPGSRARLSASRVMSPRSVTRSKTPRPVASASRATSVAAS